MFKYASHDREYFKVEYGGFAKSELFKRNIHSHNYAPRVFNRHLMIAIY